ncbi:hypothetical protein HT102_12335 [Hoyosella sp. G463]|uniref:Uncharacterized protein n=2 Tax=Lolliginicoccus lacisalsi TaxID=2742202 RepID=A0A927JER8_9ACTN|nr:hypothetical protein [Lolliginicoccus lacisalsi]
MSAHGAARAMGWATLAYSVAVLARPRVLAAPCGFVDEGQEVAPPVGMTVRGIAARDAAMGAAMALAPAGPALRLATAARAASDLADAVIFGAGLAPQGRAAKVSGVAAAWGALNLACLARM